MNRRYYLPLLLCSSLYSVLGGCAPERKEAPFPLKIGLLADTQITSQNGYSNFHYRSKFADALVEVSIRPPAMECVLSREMLAIALTKLTQDPYGDKKGVDVILYLGDAANSGGADEIDTVLSTLARHREQTGTPIFIIIGNHDFLGAGNIVTPGIRFALLNHIGRPENRPLTKYEVLKKYSEFNHGNNSLLGDRFKYRDNIDALEKNKNRDHHTGLYLSGILTYKEAGKGSVDIFLLDSSDYKNAPIWAEAANLGFYGAIGSVSMEDEPLYVSQLTLLKRYALSSRPQFRFLASHYPKDCLDRITFAKPREVPLDVTNFTWSVTEKAAAISTFSKTFNQKVEPLVLPDGKNYWLSAHTHVSTIPTPERFVVGGLMGGEYFTGLNVGSTTDYRAHVAVVERYRKNNTSSLDDAVGYREIPIFAVDQGDQGLLTSIPEAIREYGHEHASDANFKPLIPSINVWLDERGKRSGGLLGVGSSDHKTKADVDAYWVDVGATILGLNKQYREESWQDEQTDASAAHLRAFIEQFVSKSGSDRQQVMAFLGFIAGAYEKGLLSNKLDLNPEYLKGLCENPK